MTFPLACPEAAAEIPLQLQRTEIMMWTFSKTLRPMFLLPISKPATSAPVPGWVSWTSRLQAALVELTRYFSAPSEGVRDPRQRESTASQEFQAHLLLLLLVLMLAQFPSISKTPRKWKCSRAQESEKHAFSEECFMRLLLVLCEEP